jgi:two-component system cell cycle response regulator
MRILIAEDSLTQAVDLRRRLESLGHEVVPATDGLQAWRLIQTRSERLLITDWMMPEMSGLELCRKIRTELSSRYVYTILLTAKAHRHERLQGLNAGADDFLTKPVDSAELEIALKAAQRIIAAQDALQERARALELANQKLVRQASRDELTGLLNERGFDEALAVALDRSIEDRLPLTLVRLELDDAHRVVAALGLDVWDRWLANLGILLRESSRDCDLSARIGKNTFALILPGLGADSARSLADSLRTEFILRTPVPESATFSAGVAVSTPDRPAGNAKRLSCLAVQAIERARSIGGNPVVLLETADEPS